MPYLFRYIKSLSVLVEKMGLAHLERSIKITRNKHKIKKLRSGEKSIKMSTFLQSIMTTHGRRQVFESGGANDVFLLEITSIAHFCHAHQSFDS